MKKRDKVAQLAKTDCSKAFAMGKAIDDPLERAQALAYVARFCNSFAKKAFKEAVAAAQSADDPYIGAVAMAWPLRAFIETGRLTEAPGCLKSALSRIDEIKEDGSRAEAIFLLLQSAYPGGMSIIKPVVSTLIAKSGRSTHWRAVRALQLASLIVNPLDPQLARDISAAIQNVNKQASTMQRLVAGESMPPRSFFW